MNFERATLDDLAKKPELTIKATEIMGGEWRAFVDAVKSGVTHLYIIDKNTLFALTPEGENVHCDLMIGKGLKDTFYTMRDYLRGAGVRTMTATTKKKRHCANVSVSWR